MTRSDYERWARRERRRRILWALGSWALMILSAAFMVLIGWLAIVGAIAVFG
jgi:hypothetical protein